MSIYDNAGVALIPSGTKASKLYSVLPANGNGDFNATRGSTATRVNKDGLIETVATNVPRLDYPLIDGVVQDCPALLLEPSRTNIIPYSEDFTNSAWIKLKTTVSANSVIAPDGSQTADLISETTDYGIHQIYDTITLANGSYSGSIFIKQKNIRYIQIQLSDFSTGEVGIVFDFDTGTVHSTISTGSWSSFNYSVQALDNEWFKVNLSGTKGGGSVVVPVIRLLNDSLSDSYTGDANKGIYLWGAQLESGSYPTSYIPTSGSTATRSADACNGSGTSADFNSAEGVLFAELATLDKDDTSSRRISISDGTTNNVIRLTFDVASNRLYVVVYKLGTIWATYTTLSNSEGFNKVALKYKPSDFNFYVNGVKVQQQSSGATFDAGTMSEVAFDNGGGGNLFVGKCKQIMTFKTALNDSELETLTSWDSFNAMATGQLYTIE